MLDTLTLRAAADALRTARPDLAARLDAGALAMERKSVASVLAQLDAYRAANYNA